MFIPTLSSKFLTLDSDTMVLHDQSQHLVNNIVISACWEPTNEPLSIIFVWLYYSLICVMALLPKSSEWFTRGCCQILCKIKYITTFVFISIALDIFYFYGIIQKRITIFKQVISYKQRTYKSTKQMII